MMRLFVLSLVFLFSACSDAADDTAILSTSETCEVLFSTTVPCIYKNITVKVLTDILEVDEKILKALDVNNQGKIHSLTISADTSILEEDKAYISFADINFDGVSDIAITTSFGLANLYLDYWVYDNNKKQYIYLGNFTEFILNNSNKTLSNRVKVNAETYVNNTYSWQGLRLIKK